jgi:cell division protein FtsB
MSLWPLLNSWRRWVGTVFIALMLLYIADQLFYGDRGIVTWKVMRAQIADLKAENQALQADIDRLQTDILRLKGAKTPSGTVPIDTDFLDELLRRDLGLMKPNEVAILVSTTATPSMSPTK